MEDEYGVSLLVFDGCLSIQHMVVRMGIKDMIGMLSLKAESV